MVEFIHLCVRRTVSQQYYFNQSITVNNIVVLIVVKKKAHCNPIIKKRNDAMKRKSNKQKASHRSNLFRRPSSMFIVQSVLYLVMVRHPVVLDVQYSFVCSPALECGTA